MGSGKGKQKGFELKHGFTFYRRADDCICRDETLLVFVQRTTKSPDFEHPARRCYLVVDGGLLPHSRCPAYKTPVHSCRRHTGLLTTHIVCRVKNRGEKTYDSYRGVEGKKK